MGWVDFLRFFLFAVDGSCRSGVDDFNCSKKSVFEDHAFLRDRFWDWILFRLSVCISCKCLCSSDYKLSYLTCFSIRSNFLPSASFLSRSARYRARIVYFSCLGGDFSNRWVSSMSSHSGCSPKRSFCTMYSLYWSKTCYRTSKRLKSRDGTEREVRELCPVNWLLESCCHIGLICWDCSMCTCMSKFCFLSFIFYSLKLQSVSLLVWMFAWLRFLVLFCIMISLLITDSTLLCF